MQTSSTLSAILKQVFAPRLESGLYSNFPFLAMVPRDESAFGATYEVAVEYGANPRRSAVFATAQGIADVAPVARFSVPTIDNYSVASWSTKVMAQSQGAGQKAFIAAIKQQMDSALLALRKSMAIQLWGNGTGSVAQLSATTAVNTTVADLAMVEMGYMFEGGEVLQFSTVDGGAVGGGTITLSSVDRINGKLNFAGNLNSSVTVSAGDFIYHYGDAQNAGTAVVALGVKAWIPPTTASLTVAYCGVTRSSDQGRLAGVYVPNTLNNPLTEQLQDAVSILVQNGADEELKIFLAPKDFRNLAKAAGSQVLRPQGGTAKIGFESLEILTDAGSTKCFSDPSLLPGYAHVLTVSTWKLISAGKIGLLNQDGNDILRLGSSDGVEARLGGFYNLVCTNPSKNATVQI